MTQPRRQKNDTTQLTSLRFFAAMAVLLSHLHFLSTSENPLRSTARSFFYEGYVGVTFFYILSGFILSHTYQEPIRRGALTQTEYLLTRAARVFPMHLITALPFLVFYLWRDGSSSAPPAILNLLLLQSWIPIRDYYYSLNAVAWSLSDEVFFYICFLLLLRMSTRLIACLAGIGVLAIVSLAFVTIATGLQDSRLAHWFFYISPATRIFDFIIGILVFRYYANRQSSGVPSSRPIPVAFQELVVVAGLIALIYISTSAGVEPILRYQIVYLPIMAFIILTFANGVGPISNLLRARTLVFLGESSFCLYLIHQPIITLGHRINLGASHKVPPIGLAIILILISIVTSMVIHYFVEAPLYRRLRSMIRSRLQSSTGCPG